MDRLSHGDLGNFWAEGPTSPMQVAIAGVLEPGSLVDADGRFSIDRARECIARCLHRAPALRRRVRWTRFGEGAPLWIDDDAFDLARHVERVELPTPVTEAALLDYCARAAVRPLDRGRPLWRMCFVPGVDGRNVGLLVVLHHAVADGLRGVALLGALLGDAPNAREAEPSPPWTPARAPSAAELVRDNGRARLHALWRGVRGLVCLPASTARAWRSARMFRAALKGTVSRTELSREIGPGRQLRVVRRPLAPLREAGHRLGATINDLVLAAAAGGLRDWFIARGTCVTGLAIRVSVPIGAAARNGNSAMLVSLPVVEPDPRARLAAIARFTREAKAGVAAGTTPQWNLPELPRSIARLWVRWLRRYGRSRVNAYVTNVPGPPSPLWLGDARLIAATPIAPLVAGVPVSIAVFSYDGALSVAVHLDGAIEGARVLLSGLERELDGFARTAADERAPAAAPDASPYPPAPSVRSSDACLQPATGSSPSSR